MAQMFDMGDFLGPLAVGQDYLTTFHVSLPLPTICSLIFVAYTIK